MRLGTRRTLIALVTGGIAVLAAVTWIGVRQFDGNLEVLDQQERCVAIAQSANPEGATDEERALLATCASEGWHPPQR